MYPEHHFNITSNVKSWLRDILLVFFIQNIQSLVCILHLELIPSRTKCPIVTISFFYLLMSWNPKMTHNGVEKNWQKNYVNEYRALQEKKNLLKFLIIRNFTDQKKKKKSGYVLE